MPQTKRVAKRTTASKKAYAPRRTYVSGHGAYKKGTRKAPRAASSAAPAREPMVGEKIGSFIGGMAQKAFKAITGFGDYEVDKNSLLQETNGPPMVVNSGKAFTVRHREYIGEVFSGPNLAPGSSVTSFDIKSYQIQPGDRQTFPWLAPLAENFEQYRIDGMVFEYKSMYSDAVVSAATNGALGTVILATEYNAAASTFNSKQKMENYEFAQSAKPSLSILHPIECARSESVLNELYVRNATVTGSQDLRMYDFGKFQIATQGISSTNLVLGELWVTYEITFMKPKLRNVFEEEFIGSYAYRRRVGGAPVPGYTITTPLGIPAEWSVVNPGNAFNVTVGSDPGNFSWIDIPASAFPADDYNVYYYINVTCEGINAIGNKACALPVITGGFTNVGPNQIVPTIPNFPAGTQEISWRFIIKGDGSGTGGRISLAMSTSPLSSDIGDGSIVITRVPPSFIV